MERSGEPSRRAIVPKFLYKTTQIGKSKVSGCQINVPVQVMRNFGLKTGDILEWYPCSTEFPDEKERDVIAILIMRKEKAK